MAEVIDINNGVFEMNMSADRVIEENGIVYGLLQDDLNDPIVAYVDPKRFFDGMCKLFGVKNSHDSMKLAIGKKIWDSAAELVKVAMDRADPEGAFPRDFDVINDAYYEDFGTSLFDDFGITRVDDD